MIFNKDLTFNLSFVNKTARNVQTFLLSNIGGAALRVKEKKQ